ncbi:hypothetical protein CMUS01_06989 [Colletotrichum musicola]|uniref:Uncharacterized protein n=1 Tax=Colletotrichum musicola TaxID=2175873 RepID=A0A8H6NG67_9PEZI|nr:hypothetical protein CMUS01_06989 [Colletotrichum musicola]
MRRIYGTSKYAREDQGCTEENYAAFRGLKLPESPNWCSKFYVVNGIRHNEEFARSTEVSDVCAGKRADESNRYLYARARNARLIMSNTIPEMTCDEEKPYCIWHPDLASEETYRELAKRYPDMRYHVGRACAVAGYDALYRELDLLPDVSIADEARDNGSTAIFESIVSQHVRYAVMNDYRRTVELDNPRAGATLNNDAAVRSTLISREVREMYSCGGPDDERFYFDIQEDGNLSLARYPRRGTEEIPKQHEDIVYMPLPQDLPAMNKDVLINLAAWNGNVERYLRLRRPELIPNELASVIRGAYFHTPFARWLDTCLDSLFNENDAFFVRQAVNARFIMNNDLSRITHDTHGYEIPTLFWWPHLPTNDTLRELAWRRPDDVFDEIDAEPSQWQWQLASNSPNPHYLASLERRAANPALCRFWASRTECGVPYSDESFEKRFLRMDKEPTTWRSREWLYDARGGLRNAAEAENYEPSDWYDESTWEKSQYEAGELFLPWVQKQAASWNTHISATEEARGRPLLYSSAADVERRKTPAPAPGWPKDLSHWHDSCESWQFVKGREDLGGPPAEKESSWYEDWRSTGRA